MTLPLSDIQTYLTTNNYTPSYINRMPDTPDVAIAFTILGGSPASLTQDFESVHVHFRVRNTTDSLAETTALDLYTLFVNHQSSFLLTNTWVLQVVSIGGGPTYFLTDTQRRTMYQFALLFTTPVPI